MNTLVKKEIRLLLPAVLVALLLALVQGITRPYDFYVASLLFFGLTLMSLSTFGRESSLNTFSLLLAQPAERWRLWQVKLAVLATAFVLVFLVWLAAFGVALARSHVDESDRMNSYNLFFAICMIAAATFTGGLWTTLLLRQMAGAFWLTLLVPATLSGFSAVFLADRDSGNLVVAVLSVVIGVYSVAGLLLARWLFFRAQDVGWSGGVLVLPEWRLFGKRTGSLPRVRRYRPLAALFKKELQLQQASLTGAAGILILHLGVIVWRTVHPFKENTAGAVLAAIVWMLWLVMAPVIGLMSVAEERRVGVLDGQLCQPVSRRIQFDVKALFTLLLAVFLGGVMPVLVETAGASIGGGASVFNEPDTRYLALDIILFAASLALVSFFASTLARNFLQAAGLAVAAFFACVLVIPLFADGRMLFLDSIAGPRLVPLAIAVPVFIVTLLWLAGLNFMQYCEGWPLWRRNLGGFVAACVFVFAGSNAVYHRAWEIFEPAEPAHGAATLSRAAPPALRLEAYGNLVAILPGGRVWTDFLTAPGDTADGLHRLWVRWVDPLVISARQARWLGGSNYVSAAVRHVNFMTNDRDGRTVPGLPIAGYLDSLAVKTDGTLWISALTLDGRWTGGQMEQYGDAADWRQVVRPQQVALLLKSDGTLWLWGTNRGDFYRWRGHWPTLRHDQPRQVGTAADWKELSEGSFWYRLARKTDGSVWRWGVNDKTGGCVLERATNLDEVSFQTLAFSGNSRAYIRADGTLWLSWSYQVGNGLNAESPFARVGAERDWAAVALTQYQMVTLKTDGSLWIWNASRGWYSDSAQNMPLVRQNPRRLGNHRDWVALTSGWDGAIALSADGGVWLWPDRRVHEDYILMALPKQPRFLGNVFEAAE